MKRFAIIAVVLALTSAAAQAQSTAQLTPQQTRTVTQGVRAQNSGMLGGTGNAGDYAQALGLSSFGQQLQNNRRQFATSTLGARQNFYQQPMWTVMGMNPTTTPQSYTGQAQGISAGAYNPFSPESQYASNIYGSNQQSQNAANSASAGLMGSIIGGGLGMVGSIGGGYAGTF